MKKINDYLHSVWLEVGKVSFPSKKDTWEMTTLVIALSVIIAIMVTAIDFAFRYLIQWLIN